MTKWNAVHIHAMMVKEVVDNTKGWTEDQLRDKIVNLMCGLYPIRTTLYGLMVNPSSRHSGMAVTSGLFLDDMDTAYSGPEPYGVFKDEETSTWKAEHFKWSQPYTGKYVELEAFFAGGEIMHDDLPILKVVQFATACSIFIGSFDITDVRSLEAACSWKDDNDQSTIQS